MSTIKIDCDAQGDRCQEREAYGKSVYEAFSTRIVWTRHVIERLVSRGIAAVQTYVDEI